VGGLGELLRHVWPYLAGYVVFRFVTGLVAHVLHYLRHKL